MIATPDSLVSQETPQEGERALPKYSEKEIEAVMVAERIRQLVGKFPVTDAASGEVRPAKYSDIVLCSERQQAGTRILEESCLSAGFPCM